MKAPARLFVDATRQYLVDEYSTAAAFLLCEAGGDLPDPVARQYGLLTDAGPVPVETAMARRPEHKMRTGPVETTAQEPPFPAKQDLHPRGSGLRINREKGSQ